MYYGIVTLAVFMFGIQFYCTQAFSQKRGKYVSYNQLR